MTDRLSKKQLEALKTLPADGSPRETVRFRGADLSPSWSLPVLACDQEDRPGLEYLVGDTLGEGGMGVVRLAYQHGLGRSVAVKHLRASSASAEASKHLLREAQITGRLEHPTIVPIYTMGESPRLGPAVVMRRIKGDTWLDVMGESSRTIVDELNVLLRVFDGVEFAHSCGIIHRDLKPENVMLGDYGEVYVVDWGIALDDELRAEKNHDIVGTPAYIAPEMLFGRVAEVGPATDVFLLGAVLFEVLFDRAPHEGDTVREAIVAASQPIEFPSDADAPTELVSICRRACAFDRAERFQSVGEFRDAIRSFLQHQDASQMFDRVANELTALERRPPKNDADVESHRNAIDQLGHTLAKAIELHPENQVAHALTSRCDAIALDCALSSGRLDEATRIAARLGTINPGDADRLEELRVAREMERNAARDLEDAKREHDPEVSRSQRQRATVAIGAIALVYLVSALRDWDRAPELANMHQIAWKGAAIALAVVLAVLIWRRRFYANAYNATFTNALLTILFSQLASRVAGVFLGVSSSHQGAFELVLLGAVSVGLVRLHRGFVGPIVCSLFGICGVIAFPGRARIVLNTTFLSAAILTWLVWRRGQGPSAPDDRAES